MSSVPALAAWWVLASRPAEAERGLAHAGLGDLLEDVADETLPTTERAAEAGARRRRCCRDEADEPVDDRALAVAVRDALRCSPSPGPLVVAIDDVQWLDRPDDDAACLRAPAAGGEARVLVLLARRVSRMPRRRARARARGGRGAPAAACASGR